MTEITAGVSTGHDLPGLVGRLLAPVVRLAGADSGAVRLLSEDGLRLELLAAPGGTSEWCRAERQADRHCGFCGTAADASDPVWAADLRPCLRTDAGAAAAAQHMLVVPLQHRGRVLGVYNLLFAGSRQPPPAVMAMLKSVGELLGLALDNARLEAQHLQATLLRERQAMAAEVHDSVAQSLTFVKMRLPLLHDAMHDADTPRMERYYDDVREAITQAHSSLRNVLTHLRLPMDPQGLHHALRASVEALQRATGVAVDFTDRLPDLRLVPEQELNVHHIVREALANVARHAAARQVWVRLSPAEAGRLELVVEDDGSGLPAGAAAADTGSHYGLATMRERARRIGGVLEIGAREGGGTRVRLQFPAQAMGRRLPEPDGS